METDRDAAIERMRDDIVTKYGDQVAGTAFAISNGFEFVRMMVQSGAPASVLDLAKQVIGDLMHLVPGVDSDEVTAAVGELEKTKQGIHLLEDVPTGLQH